MSTWRDVLPVHPAADMFPLMDRDELLKLGEDIARNNMQAPIVIYKDENAPKGQQYSLLDGRNRLDAIEAIGLETELKLIRRGRLKKGGEEWGLYGEGWHARPVIIGSAWDPYAYVISLNIHRRHLTSDQKRDIIARLLKEDPTRSDRQIGKMTKSDHKTVGTVRTEAESRGEIPHVEKRTDTKGRAQPSKKRKLEKTKSADVEKPDVSTIRVQKEIQQIERKLVSFTEPTDNLPEPQKLAEQQLDNVCQSADFSPQAEHVAQPKRFENNPIVKAWREASEEERIEFSREFGGDVMRCIPDGDTSNPGLQ